MVLQVTFRGELEQELVRTKLASLKGWRMVENEKYGWIALYPLPKYPKAKIHVFGQGTVKIYCNDYNELLSLKELLNQTFRTKSSREPLGKITFIQTLGAAPKYQELLRGDPKVRKLIFDEFMGVIDVLKDVMDRLDKQGVKTKVCFDAKQGFLLFTVVNPGDVQIAFKHVSMRNSKKRARGRTAGEGVEEAAAEL